MNSLRIFGSFVVFSLFLCLVQGSFFFNNNKFNNVKDNGGGAECAACGIVITLLDQLAIIHDQPIEQVIDQICDFFPSEFESICVYFVNNYGEQVIELLEKDFTPDQVCLEIEFCTDPTCQIGPIPTTNLNSNNNGVMKGLFAKKIKKNMKIIDNIGENPWDWLVNLFNNLAQKHEPIEDFDGDLYSLIPTLRGSFWRGKDCNDVGADTYPGRASGNDPKVDYNCNGIYGVDENGNSYEEELCGGTQHLGVVVLGDSGGAHFEIPPSYMNASQINSTTYDNLLEIVSTEFDFPQRSGYTGFEPNSTELPYMDSVYKRMRNRNRCIHRDYQNLGVNGCRSGSMADNVIFSIARNKTLDDPLLVFFELIGNDVCSPHPTLDTMTTVPEFTANIITSLNYLETVLPAGSHVVFIGLADGRVLWNNLHNRTHPIGVTYETVYNYLDCLQICPCWVWMNSNETVRNAGSARAAELSAVYNQIIANYSSTYKNFDMFYIDFVQTFDAVSQKWVAQGREIWELIEPIDGFHPNQIAHSLLGGAFFDILASERPDFLGEINPNNEQIEQIFGDQGGYS